MKTLSSVSELPNVPAVYALYGGQGQGAHVAYVGLATKLKSRIIQHLVNHDSSVTTGTHAVNLNPERVTRVAWWEHPDFAQLPTLAAAELVAFDVLYPILRSRGTFEEQANRLYSDEAFKSSMRALFEKDPTGCLTIPTLQQALERIEVLEGNMASLEQRITELEQRLAEK
jgi:hypothetical protein